MSKDTALFTMIAGFGCLYVIPSFIAFVRHHPNRWLILVLNVAAGLTVLGWLLALIWAFQAIHKSPKTAQGVGSDGGESGLNIFANDERIVRVDSATSRADQLLNLKALREAGEITDTEFATLKAEVLRNPLAKLVQRKRYI